jgi:hypothetical protein
MKKVCLLVLSFLFFLLSFNFSGPKAYAVDLSASSSSVPEVNYELPYPGLLPDSPLYFLRIIRDWSVGFLISDPVKKSEFDLLQADKRLNAGIYLFNEGKVSLAFSTVSKAENYFGEAIAKMREAKTEGRDVSGIKENLMTAVKKHEEELGILAGESDINFKKSFQNELKIVTGFDQGLSQ